MRLFENESIRTYLQEKWEEIKNDINQIPDQDILSLDINDFLDYYYDKYYIEPITILDDKISPNIEKTKIEKANPFYSDIEYELEPRSFFVDGYKINYDIPFTGNPELLFLEPTMRILKEFEIDDMKNTNSKRFLPSICYSVEIEAQKLDSTADPKELIDNTFSKEFSSYKSMISGINTSLNIFNTSLKSEVKKLLDEKQKSSSKFSSLLSKINIPLKVGENAPNSTPLTLSIKKDCAKYPEKKDVDTDYCISDEDYNNIKNIINL